VFGVLVLLCAVSPALALYNCSWHHRGHTYDLFPASRWGHQGDYQDDGQLTHLYSYSMNLCQPSHTQHCGDRGFGMCQYDRITKRYTHDLGFWSGPQPVWSLIDDTNPRSGLKLVFTNGRSCNVSNIFRPITTTVLLPCHDLIPSNTFHVVENLPSCAFQFTLPGHVGCPLPPLPEPPLPEIPHSYRATMEVTIASHNETFWLHEIFDVQKQKVRNDQFFHPGGFVTNVIDFRGHHRYNVINGSKCVMNNISPTERMESVFDMLREHRHILRFRGILEARGVICDVWEGWWTFVRDGQTYYEDAVWFFALPHWRVIEDPLLHRRPVSAYLRSNFSRSHLRFPELHAIQFIEFQPHLDHRAEREVDLQWQWGCPGGPDRPSDRRPNFDGMSSGGVAGLSLFFLALGGAFGVGGLWYYQKRTGTAGSYGTIGTTSGSTASDGTATAGGSYQSASDE